MKPHSQARPLRTVRASCWWVPFRCHACKLHMHCTRGESRPRERGLPGWSGRACRHVLNGTSARAGADTAHLVGGREGHDLLDGAREALPVVAPVDELPDVRHGVRVAGGGVARPAPQEGASDGGLRREDDHRDRALACRRVQRLPAAHSRGAPGSLCCRLRAGGSPAAPALLSGGIWALVTPRAPLKPAGSDPPRRAALGAARMNGAIPMTLVRRRQEMQESVSRGLISLGIRPQQLQMADGPCR